MALHILDLYIIYGISLVDKITDLWSNALYIFLNTPFYIHSFINNIIGDL